MSASQVILSGLFLLAIVNICGIYFITQALISIQRTIARLPTAMNNKPEILLAPHAEAREGDVKVHIPSFMLSHD